MDIKNIKKTKTIIPKNLNGVELQCSVLSIEETRKIQEKYPNFSDNTNTDAIDFTLEIVNKMIISWNIEENSNKLEINKENIQRVFSQNDLLEVLEEFTDTKKKID